MGNFLFRDEQTGQTVMAFGDTQEAALTALNKYPDRAQVVIGQTSDGGYIVKSPSGQETLVGKGYSTTDPKKVAEAKAGSNIKDITTSAMQQDVLQQVEQKSPFGRASGPIVAGAQALGMGAGSWMDEALRPIIGEKGSEALGTYARAQQAQRPLETLAAQLGVSVAEMAALVTKFPAIGKWLAGGPQSDLTLASLRAALAGFTGGAATGAVQSAGQAPEGERLREAVVGGTIGGITGGVLGGATPSVSKVIGGGIERLRQSDVPQIAAALNVSQTAARIIRDTFKLGGNMDQAIENVTRAGEQGIIADAGYAAQALTDAAASASPVAGQQVRTAITSRASDVAKNLDAALTRELGDAPLGPVEAVRAIAKRTEDERSRAYRSAYGQIIDYGTGQGGERILQVLDRMDPSIIKSAFEKANARMRADGVGVPQISLSFDDNGNIIRQAEMPNVVQLDYLKRALQGMAGDTRDPVTKALSSDGQLYNKLARDLRSVMGETIRGYDRAVQIGGDNIADQSAFMLGRDLLKQGTQVEDVIEELAGASATSLTAARQGLRQFLRTTLNDVKAVPSDPDIEARQLDAFLRLTSSNNARDKIVTLLGKEEAAPLLAEMDKVAQAVTTRAALNQNSKTAIRQAVEQQAKDVLAPSTIGQLMRGDVPAGAKAAVQAITGMDAAYDATARQKLFNEIARAMVTQRGEAAVDTLKLMKRAFDGQTLTTEQNEALTREIASVLYAGGRTAAESQLNNTGTR